MSRVRVTVERPCPACQPAPPVADVGAVGGRCRTCHGRGVVDEPMTCAGCRHFRAGNTILAHRCGLLVGIWSGDSIGVDPDFACAAWEERR